MKLSLGRRAQIGESILRFFFSNISYNPPLLCLEINQINFPKASLVWVICEWSLPVLLLIHKPSLYFPSRVQLRRQSDRAVWWTPGIQPSSKYHTCLFKQETSSRLHLERISIWEKEWWKDIQRGIQKYFLSMQSQLGNQKLGWSFNSIKIYFCPYVSW